MNTTQSTSNSVFVSTATNSDSPTEGHLSNPRPLSGASSYRDKDKDLPFTSQSWPVSSEFPPRCSSSSAVGGPEAFDESIGPVQLFDGPSEIPWSPAADFLYSFAPTSSAPAAESIPGYVLGSTIGYGAFSVIKEATSPSGGIVAVKILRHSAFAALPGPERAKQRSRLSREARIWVSLSHENILPLFDSYRNAEATYLITLYCPAGSLLDILKRDGRPALEQTDVGYMFRQIVKALQYLHESIALVHGDVKLENVLVDECGVCRLADFGLARHIGSDLACSTSEDDAEPAKQKERRGKRTGISVHLSLLRHGPQRHRKSEPTRATATPRNHPERHMFLPGSLPYASPELLLPPSHSAEAGGSTRAVAHPAQDMWALGVLLYTLLTGTLPFRDAFEPRLQMKILRGTYDMPPAIGQHAESVLKGCLQRDAGERWTIAQVDNAAWGVGYGHVELDPVLREEQRSQSQEHLTPQAARDDELARRMSSWSIGGAPPVGRSPLLAVRGQSRSPSPSIAPRTPDDDDEGSSGYFGARGHGRHASREEAGVQIVVEGAEWDPRDRVIDEDGVVGPEGEAEDLALRGEDLGDKKRVEGARGRQDAPRSYDGDRRKSQSRTRSWTMGDLEGPMRAAVGMGKGC